MSVSEAANREALRFSSAAEWFEALESPLLGYALRLVKDSDVAQDIVQDAFLRLHTQFDQVREPRAWLYRTVRNLGLNHLRRQGREIPADPCDDAAWSGAVDPSPAPDEALARWEAVGLVRVGLLSLDERSRELLRLKFTEELSYQEISNRTGLKIGYVGYLLHHALKSLASRLDGANRRDAGPEEDV